MVGISAPVTLVLSSYFNPGPSHLLEPSSSSFSFLSGFFSPHFALPHESTYWILKTLIWSIDLREQGILAPLLVFFRIDSVYNSRIFQPKNHHYLGFHSINQYLYYTTIGWCQGVEKLANLGNRSACSYVMCSLLCIKWKTLGLWFNVNCFGFLERNWLYCSYGSHWYLFVMFWFMFVKLHPFC